MSFVLRKIAGTLAMPTGLLWLAQLAAIVVLWRRRRRRAALAVAGFCLLYTVAGANFTGSALLAWLERDYQEPAAAGPYDAVFVLGGGTSVTPWGEPALGPSGDRVLRAARTYLRGDTKVLVAAGKSIPGLDQAYARDLSAETRAIWIEMGIPPDAIIRIQGPTATREEIVAFAKLARERGWTRVGLVTSAWHLRRAMGLAERHGLPAVPIAAHLSGRPVVTPTALIPSGNGFYRVRRASWELLGAALGR